MIPVTTFAGRRVAVFGLARSGLDAMRALMAGGAVVTGSDDSAPRAAEASAQGFPITDLAEADWSGFDALVLSPGVPLTHPAPHWTVRRAGEAGVEVIGDTELFFRERAARDPAAPVVAITGTNGKSTTTALIGHLLRAAGRDVEVGGNIGKAVLGLAPFAPGRAYVLELSSYQIDLTPTLQPTVGVLLNVTPDHLDRHGSLEHYADVKARIAAHGGVTVIAVDDEFTRAIADRADAAGRRVVRVSAERKLRDGVFARGSAIVRAEGGAETVVADLAGIGSLRGSHNAQNAVAAVAAVQALGVGDAAIAAGLGTFPGLAHRMELVGRRGRVLFVNDSKATNAEAAARSLASFEAIHWIVGGRPKSGGIESLRAFFPRIQAAYLIGEAARDFARTLGSDVPHRQCGDLATAVGEAAAAAAADPAAEPVVLLAPACASFDQFPDFEARGDAFRRLVAALPEGDRGREAV
ncbi:UDP-N-acetylmuramoylalanine--D-glutamate ligase [Tepidamorphus gemmatus]|uniref:UDP-N-acetylmuramoylalanine--D-glutamate ligase n=1 Tax=Tepidamorphus gemmatus TaxID=747076 RepID=A0A4R3MM14_9HYPH|nr:UDP-N-acetylmuramoyl-L-alanine--D-glutamate ligase [Tepidamorphus gemmatus]TCT13500.1 UDP-N-acetylmuramoylalanine--D-glutamate ligase [Tepidamorphus gemmatus]